jgi:uncharacterized membrane protein
MPFFHIVDVESILYEKEVGSRQARVTVRRAITIDPIVGSGSKFYWSFRMPFFHIVDVESILGEKEVRSRHTRVTVRKGSNF